MATGTPLNNEEIEAFVVTSQQGDSDAFAKIYDLFVDRIYRYVYYRVGATDAEDLTELIFLKTLENIRQYRPGTNTFSSWLFRIAHNVVIDHYRAHDQSDELSENVKDERPAAQIQQRADNAITHEVLTEAMKQLKDDYRQIIILKYLNEFSNDEICEIMGRSHAALRILQFRALKTLRRILEDMGITEFDV